jgi:methylenetetrahydrofolate reductase (NADPH)
MVRGPGHLDELVDRMGAADIDEVFVVGGDAATPHGPYAAALDVLPAIAAHPRGPRAIGVAAYPEGHPLIDDATLWEVLARKAELATSLTTQLCFDPASLLRWLGAARERGIELPALIGLPGVVERRRLVEVSMRVGVGPSMSFLRKQRGLRHLLGRPSHMAETLLEAVAPHRDDPAWGIAGWHYFTFNRLVETWEWDRDARRRYDGERAVASRASVRRR